MAETMIQFSQVSKRYPDGYEALNQVSFSLDKGEMAFVTGHSGAGKSTLLKLVLMMERASQGQILLNNQNLNQITARQIPYLRRKIGMIFQDPRLLADRTIFENVALPLHILGFNRSDIQKRVRASLDKVGLLSKEKLFPHSLSCGEQQRVGIARAVVHKPILIVADEPTGNLDPELSSEIISLFEQFNHVGVAVLIASHDLALIAQFPYRVFTLSHGHLKDFSQ